MMNGSLNQAEIVKQFEPFVHAIARKVKKSLNSSIELDDLISYGMTGLLEAAERFDSRYGANFTTFSYYRVRGAIYDGLRKMGFVSRTEYQKIRFGEKATAYLENMASRTGAGTQDKRAAGEHLEELATQVSQLVTIYVTSLEAQENKEFADNVTPSQDRVLEDRQMRGMLLKALAKLEPEDKTLIQHYYFGDLNLEETGKRMGLSKSWTCRKHAQAIEKLSANFSLLMKTQHLDVKTGDKVARMEGR